MFVLRNIIRFRGIEAQQNCIAGQKWSSIFLYMIVFYQQASDCHACNELGGV
jgi:hypothetical protein